MDIFDKVYINSNDSKNENIIQNWINYPTTENSGSDSDDNNSQLLFEGNKNLSNINQFFDMCENDSSSILYDDSPDPLVQQNLNPDDDCRVVSAYKCCNGEVQELNPKENLAKSKTQNDQENKDPQQSQMDELEFNKNEKPNEDKDSNNNSIDDNEPENKTSINNENSSMDIEDDSFNLPSPDKNMNSNKVDLNSSNINNKAVEKDEKNKRKNDRDQLRETTLTNIKDSLYKKIVNPLIKKILKKNNENDKNNIWKPVIGREIRGNKEEIARYCIKTLKKIFLETEPCNYCLEGMKKNQEKNNKLYESYENSKNNEDYIIRKTFKDLMDLPFIEMIKIYYYETYPDKNKQENLKNIDKNNLIENLKNIVSADFQIDFKNKDTKEICKKRKEALKDFIDFTEKIKKQRFITFK